MKELNVETMVMVQGGGSGAFMCGLGVGIAIAGFAFSGGLSTIALTLCLTGDTRQQ
jgi:hypothetical protein